MKLDPIVYWVNVSHVYSCFSPVACDILSVPASSASVERTFSISREASRGKRNRLADYNLECETLLKMLKISVPYYSITYLLLLVATLVNKLIFCLYI